MQTNTFRIIGAICCKTNSMIFGISFLKEASGSCTTNSSIFKNLKQTPQSTINSEVSEYKHNIAKMFLQIIKTCWSHPRWLGGIMGKRFYIISGTSSSRTSNKKIISNNSHVRIEIIKIRLLKEVRMVEIARK